MNRVYRIEGFYFDRDDNEKNSWVVKLKETDKKVVVHKDLYYKAFCNYLVMVKGDEVIKCWNAAKKLIWDNGKLTV